MNLHPLDDQPFHQGPWPMEQTATGDPNAYDRYFFHGYDATQDLIFVVALGLYPNREVIDASLCVSHGGRQRSVFASGRMPKDRATTIGPVTVEVVDAMRTLRVTVDAPEQDLVADMTFEARSAAVMEPRQTMMDRRRVIMDTCRFTQFGRWSGSITSGEHDFALDPATTHATRDRSWGVRPLSGATPMAPGEVGGIYWLWAPLQFDDHCVHVALSEGPDGLRQLVAGVRADDVGEADPWDAEDSLHHVHRVDHDIAWEPGTRRAREATIQLTDRAGEQETLTLTPVGKVLMRGAGYLHPERGHGAWHGELEVVGEELDHADVGEWDYWALHVQQLVRVAGDHGEGIGILEQLPMGPHTPTGLTGFMDPAG